MITKKRLIVLGITLAVVVACVMEHKRQKNIKYWWNDGRHGIFKDFEATIQVCKDDVIDAEYIRGCIKGITDRDVNDHTGIWNMNDGFLSDLADYMEENNYILKPSKYYIYRNSMFVDGKVLNSNGIKRKILKFEKKQEEVR